MLFCAKHPSVKHILLRSTGNYHLPALQSAIGFSRNRNQSNWRSPTVRENNPFHILGIPKTSSYQQVKQRFLELALKHHPDVLGDGDDGSEFIRFRAAFEMIRETEDGKARLSGKGEDNHWTDEEFQAWFYEETGHQDVLFKIDLSTRKEVIEVANSLSQGGLDRGGMWEMARTMAEEEKSLQMKKDRVDRKVRIETDEKSSASRRRRRRS